MTEPNKELNIPKQKDLTQIPSDAVVEGVIVDLQITNWAEITKDEQKKKNLKDPEGEVLQVKYDVQGLLRHDIFALPKMLTNASKYGRFLEKYNTDKKEDFAPSIGMKIKVFFDAEGRSDIVIKK